MTWTWLIVIQLETDQYIGPPILLANIWSLANSSDNIALQKGDNTDLKTIDKSVCWILFTSCSQNPDYWL